MSDILIIAACLWLIILIAFALHFIVVDFDRSRREEWIGAGLVLSGMAVALALALLQIGRSVDGVVWPGLAWVKMAAGAMGV
jgi:hypothetical protein